jgi:hypothetical protein
LKELGLETTDLVQQVLVDLHVRVLSALRRGLKVGRRSVLDDVDAVLLHNFNLVDHPLVHLVLLCAYLRVVLVLLKLLVTLLRVLLGKGTCALLLLRKAFLLALELVLVDPLLRWGDALVFLTGAALVRLSEDVPPLREGI